VTRLDTALGRPILWNYPSNRFAVIGSAAGTIVLAMSRLIGGRPVTIGNLIGTFLALFLAWAVAREIDPDETLSAGVALVLAFLALLQFGFASLWLVGGVLLGLRLIVGTVGVSVRWGDAGVLALLAAYVGYRYASWIVIAVVVVGAVMAGGRRRVPAGVMVVAGGMIGLAFTNASAGFVAPSGETLAALVGMVAAIVILWNGPPPASLTDLREKPIGRDRLLTGRVAATVAVVVVSFQTGLFAALSPIAAALLAAAAVRLVRFVQDELTE
jgi:hypothetical protein